MGYRKRTASTGEGTISNAQSSVLNTSVNLEQIMARTVNEKHSLSCINETGPTRIDLLVLGDGEP
jgi:hypothetical protein